MLAHSLVTLLLYGTLPYSAPCAPHQCCYAHCTLAFTREFSIKPTVKVDLRKS